MAHARPSGPPKRKCGGERIHFVTLVTWCLRVPASPNAYIATLSMPLLVKMDVSMATSLIVPMRTRPPAPISHLPSFLERTQDRSRRSTRSEAGFGRQRMIQSV
jgi:hypothetical protein